MAGTNMAYIHTQGFTCQGLTWQIFTRRDSHVRTNMADIHMGFIGKGLIRIYR
jgi:hypothetical protein